MSSLTSQLAPSDSSRQPATVRVWWVSLLSALGALLGIAGTALLSCDRSHIAAVFALYLLSNAAWIAVGIRTRQWSLFFMNLVYMSLGLYGISH